MDHSLQAYIGRLSTEKLEHFVAQYHAGEPEEDYSYIIPYIKCVPDRRKAESQQ